MIEPALIPNIRCLRALTELGESSMQAGPDVEECYRRAAEARRIAGMPNVTLAERADLPEVERRWLSLAQSPKRKERVDTPQP
jgi:hypothetical protein